MVYYLIACEFGEILYGKFSTKEEAEKKAREIGKKKIARIDSGKCQGTRGSYIVYRVGKGN